MALANTVDEMMTAAAAEIAADSKSGIFVGLDAPVEVEVAVAARCKVAGLLRCG